MIAALIIGGLYLLFVFPVASLLGRSMCVVDQQPEPDFLWGQPTDCLSDAAVKVRFDEIVAHFSVRS